MNNIHFSSQKLDYLTPQSLLEFLYEVFDFDLDPCSDKPHGENPNVKALWHFTKIEDGLEVPWWSGVVFMNPPYGREISRWMNRAVAQSNLGNTETIVCLVPARTDTKWWQHCVLSASFVVFIKGRLKFSGHKNSAPFPSALIIFGEIDWGQMKHLSKLGWAMSPRVGWMY